jgi:hypothetical protein
MVLNTGGTECMLDTTDGKIREYGNFITVFNKLRGKHEK